MEAKCKLKIILLNLQEVHVSNNIFSSVAGDARDLSKYQDKSIDVVYSNSVIEHLFKWENQVKMANEVARVGKNYFVQTPNYWFPVEPHWLFPFFQFLPHSFRVWLTQNFSFGHYKKTGNYETALNRVNEVHLLTVKEMKQLFPAASIYKERFFGFVKSFTAYNFSAE
ncbi:MAG: class I SAM-dependent methyltransferase [Chitinophagaceae bacterium]|nr:class I SAM-dependent methyltransferase [Chitinophagaceae bacterium]